MKKITIFIIANLFSFFAFGQFKPIGIKTNPNNAINPERPDMTNTFDWRLTSQSPYFNDFNSPYWDDIISPWFVTGHNI